MAIINLKIIYPFYHEDYFVEVPNEVAKAMKQFDSQESAYKRKMYRNKAYFSLDQDDGIEHSTIYVSPSPDEIHERNVANQQLHAAMTTLSEKQAKRIYAHFFLGLSKPQIAKAEGVRWDTVSRSISHGLRKMEKFFKNL